MKITKEEAVDILADGMDIFVTVGDDTFKIADMHNYIGAPDGEQGYISEYLGNVWYSNELEVINDTIKGMADGDKELIDSTTIYME